MRPFHCSANIWPIVSKVKVKRWEGEIEKSAARDSLMHEMERRQAAIDALQSYRASAESDAAMKELVAEFDKLA